MAQKIFNLPGVGDILVAKRRGTKHLRLSITSKGQVRVGIPAWTPYAAGLAFAKSRADWIEKHLQQKPAQLADGDKIGKSHRLLIQSGSSLASRIVDQQVIITASLQTSPLALEKRIIVATERALKKEAEKLLPQRLETLAKKYGFSYNGLKIKKLTSRWGSCSSRGEITLSYYLIQLPWELIDYVILHELTHTQHLNHSPSFWHKLDELVPNAKAVRQQLKSYKPVVFSQT